VLQRRQAATARSLADELQVSLRTLYRDVASLADAGVPLYTERGPGGGIRLVPGWRTRLDGLTAQEAGALSLAGVPEAQQALGLASVALTAQAKLDATLPPELRGRAQRLRERFLLDAAAWFHQHKTPAALATVADAVWSERRLSVHYAGRTRHAQRRVDPLGLVMKAGVWYLVARHRSTYKSYQLARITRVRTLEQSFVRPADFDLPSYWQSSLRRFDTALLRYECRVRLTQHGFQWLPQLIPGDALREQLRSAPAADARGERELTLRLESEAVAATQLLGLGDDVEVLAPPALRERMRTFGERMARRHAAATTS
jgi:predicted DNA-binding transcriptional regulator YafY